MDDMRYSSYTSAKIRSRQQAFNETGDAMVRGLDLSRITLRLISETDKKGTDEDDIKAKLQGSTLDTLRRCLYTPQDITLKDSQGHSMHFSAVFRPNRSSRYSVYSFDCCASRASLYC